MTNTFLNYFLWALLQHTIIIAAVWFWPLTIILKVLLSVALFAGLHYPNESLMSITFVGGGVIYTLIGVDRKSTR